jgi:hypothetical protein
MPGTKNWPAVRSVAPGRIAGRGKRHHSSVVPHYEQVVRAYRLFGARDAEVSCCSAGGFLLEQFDALDELITDGGVGYYVLPRDSHLIFVLFDALASHDGRARPNVSRVFSSERSLQGSCQSVS